MIKVEELRDFLEEKYRKYNTPDFITDDPVSIPHRFTHKHDIEIAGFLTATISWGRRKSIVDSAGKLMEMMEHSPAQFAVNAEESDIKKFNFIYRTLQAEDTRSILRGLGNVYRSGSSLEQIFSEPMNGAGDTAPGIRNLRQVLSQCGKLQPRTLKHLPDPAGNSAAKRMNMFLRWMVRKDQNGVDFGIWNSIHPSQLVCPVDVHAGNVARKLGLIQSRQINWNAAMQLTCNLRKLDPEDPVKFDFALFGLGIYENFAS